MVTACTFGGTELDALFITARVGIPDGEQPQAVPCFAACREPADSRHSEFAG